MDPFNAELSRVLKYNAEVDRQILHQQVLDNPDDLTTRGVYADFLQDHDRIDEHHADMLRNEPGRVLPLVGDDGRVHVQHWQAMKGAYRTANAQYTDAVAEHPANDDGWVDYHTNVRAAAHRLADTLQSHHDARHQIVRRHADDDYYFHVGGDADHQPSLPAALGVDNDDSLNDIREMDRRGASMARNPKKAAELGGIPLLDGTHLGYEILHHVPTERRAVRMWWNGLAGNNFEAHFTPAEAEEIVRRLTPHVLSDFQRQVRRPLRGSKQ